MRALLAAFIVLLGALLFVDSAEFTSQQKEFLARHNSLRAKHGVPPLVLDPALNKIALDWSQVMARIGSMHHRPNNIYGENLFMMWSSANLTMNSLKANDVVDSWYNEISKYNYNNPVFSPFTGHFTQVIWKSSKKLGCGCAITLSKMKIFCTCNYDPHGNVVGSFSKNVPKPLTLMRNLQ